MGLGSLGPYGAPAIVSLEEARQLAQDARALKAKGIDPLDARDAAEAAKAAEEARRVTFQTAAERYIEAHSAKWRNQKHRDQWESTLKAYAYSAIGDKAVSEVDAEMVLGILRPLWSTRTETASRVRGRIEIVLDWAKWKGYREGENPARWRGNLAFDLPPRRKVRPVVHHPALPYAELPDFLVKLRERPGIAADALEFLILTVGRTGEVIGARWPEIDRVQKLWIVPAARMKAGKEHRVTLSDAALSVLDRIDRADDCDLIFQRRKRALSNNALLALLSRMKRDDVTAHGFRSTFRSWAADKTSFPREVAELCLAHAIGDEVENSYMRSDLLEKRRRLMNAWAGYCASPAGASVTSIDAARQRAAS